MSDRIGKFSFGARPRSLFVDIARWDNSGSAHVSVRDEPMTDTLLFRISLLWAVSLAACFLVLLVVM
jgi:hypothetical protein